jgi:hypothetical protein
VKSIKMFGLAALAALMAMAFVGAGWASAESTQLCNMDPTGPGCGSPVTSIHSVSVGKAKLLTSFVNIECNVLFSSTFVGGLGSPQVTKGHFTYTNCGCTVVETGLATVNILKEGHETAKATFTDIIRVNCFGIECELDVVGLVGTAKGPLLSPGSTGNGVISLEQPFTALLGGFFCPGEGKLDITLTPLSETYIAG